MYVQENVGHVSRRQTQRNRLALTLYCIVRKKITVQ